MLAGLSNKKNQKIINPSTGGYSFGQIPEGSGPLLGGEIYLKLGYIGHGHPNDPNKKGATGARHIYEKHGLELNLDYFNLVPSFVNRILQDEASILIDKNRANYIKAPIVVNSPHGMVALGQNGSPESGISYEIVSAYERNDQKGTKVGEIKKPAKAGSV